MVAIEALASIVEKDDVFAVESVIALLDHPDISVKQGVMAALPRVARNGNERAVAAVTARLNHADAGVRQAAIFTLANIADAADARSVCAIATALRHEDEIAEDELLNGGRLGGPSAVDEFCPQNSAIGPGIASKKAAKPTPAAVTSAGLIDFDELLLEPGRTAEKSDRQSCIPQAERKFPAPLVTSGPVIDFDDLLYMDEKKTAQSGEIARAVPKSSPPVAAAAQLVDFDYILYPKGQEETGEKTTKQRQGQ
eukprot:gnl/TRDRNA2_/TRDRNA2_152031_c1_seq1.p1 gnl/TRDRNA2_/TRDRNA2_152031_c1~~gnl/TRDRNA2_/TRDRNA2_152031_c1_seq1.p1  ORF type:complete len:253 (+),score=49.91 gnl/TRDRNA2_/TRDRNA2_152031_c1_seq1:50-808(+)